MNLFDGIHHKLTTAFCPLLLDLQDESHLHVGHAGVEASGGKHASITIVSAAFEGKSRMARHRMVQHVLAEELKNISGSGLHALKILARTPQEHETC